MGSNSVDIAEVDYLDDKVGHNLVEVVISVKTTKRRTLCKENIDKYDTKAANREDRVVAKCRE